MRALLQIMSKKTASSIHKFGNIAIEPPLFQKATLRRSTDPDAMRFVSNDPDHPSEIEGEEHGRDDQCSHRQSSAWGLYGVVVSAKTLTLVCLPSA